MDAETLIRSVADWVAHDKRVRALALVGSHARGEARPDSDIDLVLICEHPNALLEDVSWTHEFGEARVHGIEDYGLVQSVRVFYQGGPEVEFGITSLEWATPPIDEGTAQVMRAGVKSLYDPKGLLETALSGAREQLWL